VALAIFDSWARLSRPHVTPCDRLQGRLLSAALATISDHGEGIDRTAATLTLERGGERRHNLGFELELRGG